MKFNLFHKHDWEYYDYQGFQSQPKKRTCLKCKRNERWVGAMLYDYELSWRVHPENWKTDECIEKEEKINSERRMKLNEILNDKQ